MRSLTLIISLSTFNVGCGQNGFFGVGSNQLADNGSSLNSEAGEENSYQPPETLMEGLEQALEFVQSSVGNDEFSVRDFTFANYEEIFSDAILKLEDNPDLADSLEDAYAEASGEVLLDDAEQEEAMQVFSEYSVDYLSGMLDDEDFEQDPLALQGPSTEEARQAATNGDNIMYN